jgi:hypothetical protein
MAYVKYREGSKAAYKFFVEELKKEETTSKT